MIVTVPANSTLSDAEQVAALLGREPGGDYDVVVRSLVGEPVVIANAPLLRDRTPMPTLFWLIGSHETALVASLEANGGVREAEASLDPVAIAEAHALYQQLRDALIAPEHEGPRPSGGVAGTRQGVKCLHAHLAWWLANGDDPVGEWTAQRLELSRDSYVRDKSTLMGER